MRDLSITLIQADLIWSNIEANLLKFERLFTQIKQPTDVVVLPEMFTTGFNMEPEALAESFPGRTTTWMKEQARLLDAAIVGSLIIKEDNNYYNRLLWVMPDGEVLFYDKRHLFTLAGEHLKYSAGKEQLLVHFRGWKIMPLVCYDLRFPVWSRNTQDYDLLIYIANFPDRRSFAWRSLLRARAIENQSYTIGLNRVGVDGNDVYYAGDSCVLSFDGHDMMLLPPREIVKTMKLTADSLYNFRKKLAFLNDRDTFVVKYEN